MINGFMWAALAARYAEKEIARLDEKARLLQSGMFDARAAESDRQWREQNESILSLMVRDSDLFA